MTIKILVPALALALIVTVAGGYALAQSGTSWHGNMRTHNNAESMTKAHQMDQYKSRHMDAYKGDSSKMMSRDHGSGDYGYSHRSNFYDRNKHSNN